MFIYCASLSNRVTIQAYVDAVLDLASHFITRLRRYASFCRTLASHAGTSGTGGSRNMVTSPTQSTSAAAPATTQGEYTMLVPDIGYKILVWIKEFYCTQLNLIKWVSSSFMFS